MYMCRAKKSREAYEALNATTEEIESERTERVPEIPEEQTFPGQSGKINRSRTNNSDPVCSVSVDLCCGEEANANQGDLNQLLHPRLANWFRETFGELH